jgi:hypothetical protein
MLSPVPSSYLRVQMVLENLLKSKCSGSSSSESEKKLPFLLGKIVRFSVIFSKKMNDSESLMKEYSLKPTSSFRLRTYSIVSNEK